MTSIQVDHEKRITYKRKRPNPIFQEWLENLHENAKVNNSKMEPMLREALDSLSKYPLPLKTGAECAILKGFNSKLCKYLDIHLQEYYSYDKKKEEKKSAHNADETTRCFSKIRKNNPDCGKDTEIANIKSKKSPQKSLSGDSSQLENNNSQTSCNYEAESARSKTANSPNRKVTKPKERMYKPTFRSGAYAILVALLDHMQECPTDPALTKESLIERAQKHSEESFVRPKPESFYTAWSNITRLVTKGLVEKTKKKKLYYCLTSEGIILATELLKESASEHTVNDIIFNTPESTITCASGSQDSVVAIPSKTFDTNSVSSQSIGSQSSNTSLITVEMPAGTFEIILLIDKNETGGVSKKNDPTVAQFNKYPDLKHEYRSLKVGDFTWIAQHKVHKDQELVLPYVVERKRMDDLGGSIKDGRFYEQKFRLRKCGLKNVIYMVENYGSNKHVGLPLQSLMQALANTRVQDGFKVHTTESLSNSARFLAMMTKRLTIEFKNKNLKGYNKEPIQDNLMTFQYFNKSSAKTKPLTVKETFILLLLQLKGISVEKALAVTNTYSTPASLIKAYADCSQKEGEMLLANLKYGATTCNVGPKISKSVYQLFTYTHLS